MSKVAIGIDILFVPDPTKDGVIALGDVYIGNPDADPEVETHRKEVTVIQEDGTEVLIAPSAQPLRTGAGGVLLYQGSAVTVLVDGEYSLKINDSLGAQIYYVPSQNAEATISISGGKIINGSFEAVTGTTPDNWTLTPTAGGTIESDGTDQGNGLFSLRFDSEDSAGAGLAVSTALDVSTGVGVDVGFMLKTLGVTSKNTVWLEYLNSAGGTVSTVLVAEINGDSPTVWTQYDLRTTELAPASAVQARIQLRGMDAGGATTGSAWFDDIRINDNSINLGNAITADNTVVLTNKTIHDGLYTGTQTGFIGDIQGRADTAGQADSIVGQGALATQDTVGAGDIDANAVGSAQLIDNSVRFSNEIRESSTQGSFTVVQNTGTQVLTTKGIYAIDGVGRDLDNYIDRVVQYFIAGQWRTEFGANGSTIAISDGANCRLANLNSGTWTANYIRLFD